MPYNAAIICWFSSAGRAQVLQTWGRWFESNTDYQRDMTQGNAHHSLKKIGNYWGSRLTLISRKVSGIIQPSADKAFSKSMCDL